MSSYEAQAKYGGLEKTYRASEGFVKKIPAKGPVANVMKEIMGGLASCGTYIGADSIKDFSKCAHFIRVNRIK
jgi:GMP reductase